MILQALRRYLLRGWFPDQNDKQAVWRLTARQWETIDTRTDTYLAGYMDRPGSNDRAQRRAQWLAQHGVFLEARNVMELGCGCGRNLAELRRRYPLLEVVGMDINAAALNEALRAVPDHSQFIRKDLHSLAATVGLASKPWVDVIFTVGVLGHLESSMAAAVIQWARERARQAVVLVEEPGMDSLAKGPRAWNAEQNTGDYILWRHNLARMIPAAHCYSVEILPADLRAPAATHLYVLRPA